MGLALARDGSGLAKERSESGGGSKAGRLLCLVSGNDLVHHLGLYLLISLLYLLLGLLIFLLELRKFSKFK